MWLILAAQLRWHVHVPVNVFHIVLSLLQNGDICSGAWPTSPGAPGVGRGGVVAWGYG